MAVNLQDYRYIFHKVGGHQVHFEVSNQDTTDTTYHYFGYVSSDGAWIIQRFYIVGDTVQYRYIAGPTRIIYDTYWNTTTGRYSAPGSPLTFTTFDQINAYLL